jgi:hypothetical protein
MEAVLVSWVTPLGTGGRIGAHADVVEAAGCRAGSSRS